MADEDNKKSTIARFLDTQSVYTLDKLLPQILGKLDGSPRASILEKAHHDHLHSAIEVITSNAITLVAKMSRQGMADSSSGSQYSPSGPVRGTNRLGSEKKTEKTNVSSNDLHIEGLEESAEDGEPQSAGNCVQPPESPVRRPGADCQDEIKRVDVVRGKTKEPSETTSNPVEPDSVIDSQAVRDADSEAKGPTKTYGVQIKRSKSLGISFAKGSDTQEQIFRSNQPRLPSLQEAADIESIKRTNSAPGAQRLIIFNFRQPQQANEAIEHGLLIKDVVRECRLYDPIYAFKQCTKCNGYGHKKSDCPNQRRCKRCSKKHGYSGKRCSAEPQCCNCGGPHCCSWNDCPVRKAAIRRFEECDKSLPRYFVSGATESALPDSKKESFSVRFESSESELFEIVRPPLATVISSANANGRARSAKRKKFSRKSGSFASPGQLSPDLDDWPLNEDFSLFNPWGPDDIWARGYQWY